MPLLRSWKVGLLGYRSLGKTSLTHQFVEDEFFEGYDLTVQSTYSKSLTTVKNKFHLHFVDTAGQNEYIILSHSFVTEVYCYVLVYCVISLLREVQMMEGKKLVRSHLPRIINSREPGAEFVARHMGMALALP